MNTASKVLIVIALLALVGVVMAVKYHNSSSDQESIPAANAPKESKEASGPDVTANVTAENAGVKIEAGGSVPGVPTAEAGKESQEVAETTTGLPRLVDLGADKCIPCKLMAPILEELKSEYAGKLQVDFFDVWKDPAAAEYYGVKVIPTQIFFDPDGRELFRHVGFYSKPDILKKWTELGVTLSKGASNENN